MHDEEIIMDAIKIELIIGAFFGLERSQAGVNTSLLARLTFSLSEASKPPSGTSAMEP